MYIPDISVIKTYLPFILEGLKLTVFISTVGCFFAFFIGLLTAFLRNLPSKPISFVAAIYTEFIRNTPLLIQLYILYKGFPLLGLKFPGIVCGIIALSLYTGAYIAEVLRSGMNSVEKAQKQASRGLGLSYVQTFRYIIYPQTIRIMISPLCSQFINLIKNSSLVSFIAVTDIFYVVYKGAADDFRIYE
ncbi:MAG: amino acid ABC transporter permease, partial [Candidatus Gastranaerophilales bacterium]|nr:amino acid ABC transporter permease [Candidatus Gastranaerophilales bacterium]